MYLSDYEKLSVPEKKRTVKIDLKTIRIIKEKYEKIIFENKTGALIRGTNDMLMIKLYYKEVILPTEDNYNKILSALK